MYFLLILRKVKMKIFSHLLPPPLPGPDWHRQARLVKYHFNQRDIDHKWWWLVDMTLYFNQCDIDHCHDYQLHVIQCLDHHIDYDHYHDHKHQHQHRRCQQDCSRPNDFIIIIIIINTRPKPPSGRQGLAGSWGKNTVKLVHFGVFSTSHFVPRCSAQNGYCCLHVVD